jgi:hypothetical protein
LSLRTAVLVGLFSFFAAGIAQAIDLRDMGIDVELLDIVDRNSESHRQTELPASEWLRIVTSASL